MCQYDESCEHDRDMSNVDCNDVWYILTRKGVKVDGSISSHLGEHVLGACQRFDWKFLKKYGKSHGNQEPGSTKKEKDDKKGSKKRLCWIYSVLSSRAFFGGDNVDGADDDEEEDEGDDDQEEHDPDYEDEDDQRYDVLQPLIRRFLLDDFFFSIA